MSSTMRRSNRLNSKGGPDDLLNSDSENVSPLRNTVAAERKPLSPVFSAVKVKPLIDAINARKALEESQKVEKFKSELDNSEENGQIRDDVAGNEKAVSSSPNKVAVVNESSESQTIDNLTETLEKARLDIEALEDFALMKSDMFYDPAAPEPAVPTEAEAETVIVDATPPQPPAQMLMDGIKIGGGSNMLSLVEQLAPGIDHSVVSEQSSTGTTTTAAAATAIPLPVPRFPGAGGRQTTSTAGAGNLSATMTSKIVKAVEVTAVAATSIATVKNSRLQQQSNVASKQSTAATASNANLTASSGASNKRLLSSQSARSELKTGGEKEAASASASAAADKPKAPAPAALARHGLTPAVAKKSTAHIPIRPVSASASASACASVSAPAGQSAQTAAAPSLSLSISARESARLAKEAATAERIAKVAELKNKWKSEHERKVVSNKVNRDTDLHVLKSVNHKAAEQRRVLTEKRRLCSEEERAQHKQALQDKLLDKKAQEEILQAQAQETRRKAALQEQKDARKAAETDKRFQQSRKEEAMDILETRRQDFLRLKEAREAEDRESKKAVAEKGVKTLEQREIANKLLEAEKALELERIAVRRQNWEDDRSAKDKQRQNRRESLAGRLDAWRAERATDVQVGDQQRQEEQETLNKRHEDWQAVQSYKQSEAASRRQSLAGRLDKWREEKKLISIQNQQAEEANQLEVELCRAELEDTNNYRAQLENDRRASLSMRLQKARADADHEEGQRAVAREMETEARRLAEQDQDDVRKNKAMVLAARRQSLEYRTQRAVQQQAVKKGEDAYAKQVETQDYQLSLEAWRDVKNYQEKCRAKERLSLANKIVEARQQQESAMEKHRVALDQLHEDLENKRTDWLEVRESKKRDEHRARKSILIRLDSWRQQRVAEAKHLTVMAARADEEGRMRELDREELNKYQKQLKLQEMHETAGAFLH